LEYRLEIAEIRALIEWVGASLARDFPFVIPEMKNRTMVVKLGSNASLVACKKWRHCRKRMEAGETTSKGTRL
jgi:hypothetical protein